MSAKTNKTALVLIPPQSAWEPIQAIRRAHDRQYRRWMPHVTLLYPFVPEAEFDDAAALARDACREIEPFDVELARFSHFTHPTGSCTIWLAPEPATPIVRFQSALLQALPDCNDVNTFPSGFVPHLSVGQAGQNAVESLRAELQSGWTRLRFTAEAVSLIARNDPPDDVFRVERIVALGGR